GRQDAVAVLGQVLGCFLRQLPDRQPAVHLGRAAGVLRDREGMVVHHHARDLAVVLEHHPAAFLLADLGDAAAEAVGLAGIGIGVGRGHGDRHGGGFRQRIAVGLRLARECARREQQEGQRKQKRLAHAYVLRRKMVGVAGFEPTTLCPPGRCATRLRYTPTRFGYYSRSASAVGAAAPLRAPSALSGRSAISWLPPGGRPRRPGAGGRRRWCSPARTAGPGSGGPSARRGAGSSGGCRGASPASATGTRSPSSAARAASRRTAR